MPKAKNVKKKFIDRKKSVTFSLVHRSQRDPLAADETAPQRVLVPVSAVAPAAASNNNKQPELTKDQRREEQQKYGVYYDDDYNYLQHLKDSREVTLLVTPKPVHKRKEKPPAASGTGEGLTPDEEERLVRETLQTLQLPSSVFASEVEEDVGLLNKAAPQGLCLTLDPEVVAALDDDFDFEDPENQLEDDFIQRAAGDGDFDEDEYDDDDDVSGSDAGSQRAFASDSGADDDSDDSQLGGPRMRAWQADDTRSRFSQYSMSSSAVRRGQGLTMLDRRFEQMFAEYDDTELGAVECEEIEGPMPDASAAELLALGAGGTAGDRLTLGRGERGRIHHLQEIAEESSSSSEEELVARPVSDKPAWDCESILSTYSTLYNHPKLIQEPKKPAKIKLHAKTGVPVDVLGQENKLTMKALARFNALHHPRGPGGDDEADGRTRAESVLSTLSVLSLRPKDESVEEKKERKRLLKEYRAERRVEKKANQEAFKEEKKRQEKISMNNRNNVQGNRIL